MLFFTWTCSADILKTGFAVSWCLHENKCQHFTDQLSCVWIQSDWSWRWLQWVQSEWFSVESSQCESDLRNAAMCEWWWERNPQQLERLVIQNQSAAVEWRCCQCLHFWLIKKSVTEDNLSHISSEFFDISCTSVENRLSHLSFWSDWSSLNDISLCLQSLRSSNHSDCFRWSWQSSSDDFNVSAPRFTSAVLCTWTSTSNIISKSEDNSSALSHQRIRSDNSSVMLQSSDSVTDAD